MKELLELAEKLQAKKVKQDAIKQKYKDKEKIKKLTTDERLARIEELLNI